MHQANGNALMAGFRRRVIRQAHAATREASFRRDFMRRTNAQTAGRQAVDSRFHRCGLIGFPHR